MSRAEQYAALRNEGLTYKEIASHFGCSRQAVAQALANRRIGCFRPFDKNRVIYDGLRNWMNENHITISELIRQYYGRNHNGYARAKMSDMLRGKRMDKEEIDFFRKITGLTYEELFCEQGDGDSNG